MNFSKEIDILIKSRKKESYDDFQELIRSGGYIPPNEELLEEVLVAIALGKNVLLKGPTGSGKTKLAETISHIFQNPMHMINCSVDLDAESMMGNRMVEYDEDDKQILAFISGAVPNSMKNGHFLYIDEINMAKPETLPILNGVLDYRHTVTNPFTQEIIKAKDGFGVVAAINEGYIGTTPLNEALKNRFVIVDVPYLQGELLKQLIVDQSILKKEDTIDLFVKLSSDLIKGVEQGKISEDAASIRALLDACDMSVYIGIKRAVKTCIIGKVSDQREKDFIENVLDMLLKWEG